jgi:hypothetical protein
MALSLADTAVVEFWTGEILPEDEDKVDGWLALYGSPYAVALHVLHRDLAEFSRSSESVGAGQDRESHGKNVDWLERQLSKLVTFVRGSDSISPGEAFEALLVGLEAGGTEYLVAVSTVADNARRA